MAALKIAPNGADHVRGDLHAPVTLVEYGDYECGSCGTAHPVVENLRRQFGRSLCFVFRHFPLTQLHPMAERSAETAEFAGRHRHFLAMHEAIYANQSQLSMSLLFALAGTLDIPQRELRDALAAGLCAGEVQADFLGGVRSGANGTPAFFINGRRHDGPFDFATLADAIGAALAETHSAV
jgi:protein-disulfide isomerase